MSNNAALGLLTLWALLLSAPSIADNPLHHNGVSRVNDPYVQALEKEIELRTFYQRDSDKQENGLLRQSITYGFALNDRVFAEAYIKGVRLPGQSFELEAYELEAKIQLTEQGEYSADWGLLVEYEREISESVAEVAAVLLTSKQWGNWIATLNLGIEYEFGSNIENEFDRFASMQWRYRFKETLEPGIELYADEFTRGIGPVLTGLIRGKNKQKWYWEAGVIAPLNDTTPDSTFRLLLEFEF
ncbi:MAG: hypothetical protein ACSHXZ_09160 [Gammaproteobacteria bacterium]